MTFTSFRKSPNRFIDHKGPENIHIVVYMGTFYDTYTGSSEDNIDSRAFYILEWHYVVQTSYNRNSMARASASLGPCNFTWVARATDGKSDVQAKRQMGIIRLSIK